LQAIEDFAPLRSLPCSRQVAVQQRSLHHRNMADNSVSEAQLYPVVERWAKSRLKCWKVAINTGPRVGRVDVAGVRDLGSGDLASRSEVVAIEVKSGTSAFAKSAGQAHGYSVMADRCYLAVGVKQVSDEQLVIASQLRIGLLTISNGRVEEVLTAPLGDPLMELRLQLLEKLHCAPCALCSTVFRIGDVKNHFRNLVRRDGNDRHDLAEAAVKSKGMVWWLWRHANERDTSGRSLTYRPLRMPGLRLRSRAHDRQPMTSRLVSSQPLSTAVVGCITPEILGL
jgi:hypothetical protein